MYRCATRTSTVLRNYGTVLGGKFSRMLDLGGAPSSGNSEASIKALNLNKNCHLQAVIFDFGLFTQTLEQSESSTPSRTVPPAHQQPPSNSSNDTLVPNVSKIQEVAKLLNVDVSGGSTLTRAKDDWKDDLTLLLRETPVTTRETKRESTTTLSQPTPLPATPKPSTFGSDIRNKYADKLKRVTGESTMVDSTSDGANTASKGDAEYLMVARARAALESTGTGHSQWLAGTGTGQLLHFLHLRSMKLGLASTPVTKAAPANQWSEGRQMNELAKQLKDRVSFDAIVADQYTAPQLIATTLALLQRPRVSSDGTLSVTSAVGVPIPPDRCLWVSDRDDCLRAAKDAGLLTARILLRPNARRGNVSAHYTVTQITEIQTVINEINGISFNAVLRGAG